MYAKFTFMKNEPLDQLLAYLISENPQWGSLTRPDIYAQQRKLLRAILNARMPAPISLDWLAIQDAELQQQLAEKGIVTWQETAVTAIDPRIRLWQGDITRLQVDAIVNAANSQMLGCFIPCHGCIDNAIHSAAGLQLREECDQMMKAQDFPEPAAQAKITLGYNLPAQHVIHTVGPIITTEVPSPYQQEQLAQCYRSCLALAEAHNLNGIAFCCISTGEFRFPNKLAAQIAVETVQNYLANSRLQYVIFNTFKDEDQRLYTHLLGTN